MTPRSSESIAFANQYRREVARLERMHANNITPGTTKFHDALYAAFDRMGEAGSSIKQAVILKNLFIYINAIAPEQRTAFPLAHYNSKRTAALSIATIRSSRHPLTGPDEEGVRVSKTVITVKRDGDSQISTAPLAFLSQHAIERMHQRRAYPLSVERATSMISGVGMLGAMICLDAYDHDAMCLNLDNEVLAVGDIKRGAGDLDKYGRRTFASIYDVRSFLCVGEMDWRDKKLEQGNAAVAAINEWVSGDDDTERCIRMIPVLAQERMTYTHQTAKRISEDCE